MVRAAVALIFLSFSLASWSQAFPSRPVKIIVPYGVGGSADVYARYLGAKLQDSVGQSFVVENRPAGSGIVGADLVAKSAPDGQTLLFAFSSLSSSAKLFSKLPYDPVRDFAPVALATTSPLLAVAPLAVPARDIREFISYAKAHDGKLNYGSSGPGSSPHLAIELLMSQTGLRMQHIAYKGIAPAVTALLADEVQFSLVPIAVGMPHVRSGKLRALGVAGLQRSSATPEVPTLAESGLPDFEVIAWWGLLAPAKTPRAIVELLNREMRAALERAEIRKTLLEQGMDPAGGTPEQFAALIKADMDKWGEIGARLGVKLD
jgi:tripartite-type tricarboxylate transporter receptor subunit TctC